MTFRHNNLASIATNPDVNYMEIARYWRFKNDRYNLRGTYYPETDEVSVFPGPNRPRQVLNGNGHGKEDALSQEVVYQAPVDKQKAVKLSNQNPR